MHHLVRLAALILTALACVGCKSLPLMGPGSMDLTLRGVELEEVVSIYLIVGDEADLADLQDPRTIEKVVRPDRQGKYVTFAQYKPQKGTGAAGAAWSLQQRALNPTHEMIEVELSKDGPELAVEIDRELLESRPQLAAAVVVNCGNKGWGASQAISRSEIESTGSLTLEVRGPAITRVGAEKK